MMNEQEFLESQKDCASMLGMNLEEYKKSLKNVKIPNFKREEEHGYDNSILLRMGLREEDLKKKRVM